MSHSSQLLMSQSLRLLMSFTTNLMEHSFNLKLFIEEHIPRSTYLLINVKTYLDAGQCLSCTRGAGFWSWVSFQGFQGYLEAELSTLPLVKFRRNCELCALHSQQSRPHGRLQGWSAGCKCHNSRDGVGPSNLVGSIYQRQAQPSTPPV